MWGCGWRFGVERGQGVKNGIKGGERRTGRKGESGGIE